jgi:hypothetical protein
VNNKVVDVEKLCVFAFVETLHKKRLREQGRDEIRELLRKRFDLISVADRPQHVDAEEVYQLLGLLFPVDNQDRIEAPAAQRVRQANGAAECVVVAGADRPADTQRAITDVDADGVHRTIKCFG